MKPDETVDPESLAILRVASDVYPEVMGGFGLHVHDMSKLQSRLGHDVTLLTSDHGNSDLARQEERDGYRLIRHREIADPVDNSIIPCLVRSLRNRSQGADVIHAHSHLFFSTNLTAIFSRFTDTPLVITNHGLMSQTAPMWIQKAFLPTVAKFTLNSADRIMCYTETDRDRLRDRGITANVSVVSNGIRCDRFRPDNSTPEGDYILFVGRLKEGKGVKYLIDAFANIADEYPDIDLKIVGEGPLRGSLRSRCWERGVDQRVTFAGNFPNEDMPELYNEATVFVLPSLSEGLPRTVLEAMSCGTPVVTSALPQLEPVVDGAGHTFPVGDVERLADHIRSLLNDQTLRESLGDYGRERILEEFSWRETVRETTEVYYELL